VFGSDYLIDDESDGPPGLPQLFRIDYLGEKKILALEHANPAAFDSPGGPAQLDTQYYYPGRLGFVPFPKPAMGKWELRDSYVIALERLPNAAKGYCYSRRVMYVDKENYLALANSICTIRPATYLNRRSSSYIRPRFPAAAAMWSNFSRGLTWDFWSISPTST